MHIIKMDVRKVVFWDGVGEQNWLRIMSIGS